MIVEIDSGAQTVAEDRWLYAGFALTGNDLVLRNDKNTEVEIRELELSANIEWVDLTTGEHTWIARNLGAPGDGEYVLVGQALRGM